MDFGVFLCAVSTVFNVVNRVLLGGYLLMFNVDTYCYLINLYAVAKNVLSGFCCIALPFLGCSV